MSFRGSRRPWESLTVFIKIEEIITKQEVFIKKRSNEFLDKFPSIFFFYFVSRLPREIRNCSRYVGHASDHCDQFVSLTCYNEYNGNSIKMSCIEKTLKKERKG